MNSYCKLAKDAVDAFILKKEIIEPDKSLPKTFFEEKSGVFVSIHNQEELRGCVGTYLPTQKNIAQEIIYSAISACKDSRFPRIENSELPFLSYEVYILEEPKIIKDLKELDPTKYGILVQSGYKSGLLLPGLEGINNTDQQIEIACNKAGIRPNIEQITIFKFLTKKYVSD